MYVHMCAHVYVCDVLGRLSNNSNPSTVEMLSIYSEAYVCIYMCTCTGVYMYLHVE